MHTSPTVRKINNINGLSKVIGFFASNKLKLLIPWESQLERDACYLFEYDENIKKYTSQPKTFVFSYQGKKIKYTPDFYVEYQDKEFEYIEIKYSESLRNEKTVKKLKLVKNYFDFIKIKFKILYDDEIRLQPRLKNIKFLYKYSKNSYYNYSNLGLEKTTIKNLSKILDYQTIYAAMFLKDINFNINQDINDDTIVWLN
ncbi:hypothetical protein D9M71_24620 [compost metagenome]